MIGHCITLRQIREGHESETKQVIPAHKFVLSISSPVFEAMFYGELAESKDSIELPDCEYESLLELFRFIYSDEVNLSGSNVMGVLYLAKKYMVPSLAKTCMAYLEKNLDPSNVFNILPSAEKYEERILVEQCWKVIDDETEAAIKSDGFAAIERSLVEAVVRRDTLKVKEVDLFKAVDFWATKKCEEKGLSADGSEKRRILGDRIVKGTRYPGMTSQEFVGVVLDCKILTQDETIGIMKYLHSLLDTVLGFPVNNRTGRKGLVYHCSRFGSMDESGAGIVRTSSKDDCLKFTVDKNISLRGVTLCGSENSKYFVTVKVKKEVSGKLRVSKSAEVNSELIRSGPVPYYGFRVMFESPIFIENGFVFLIESSISGASTCFGKSGKNSVISSGVKFNFLTCCSRKGTTVDEGQYSEFLFSVT
ncbi:BTB/POZ domain-containing protein 6 [Stylophora pistillata]|uniref:BTB/POZ domain-containing protein 6 n=1 Tax=Stylophora pistillata TaxID=50429 RepID=A0A2B4S521_STYPI|nr:BTB/POZ domain-containing protein 6 [Stylophora pistillata]